MTSPSRLTVLLPALALLLLPGRSDRAQAIPRVSPSSASPPSSPAAAKADSGGWREWQTEDARLAQRVTFTHPRLYTGELLDALSKQTGVELSANDEDGAAGMPLCVSLSGLTLRETMDALLSLEGYQKAPWYWERTGSDQKWSYRLTRGTNARRLAEMIRAEIQADFAGYVDNLMQAAWSSDEDRKQVEQKDPRIASALKSSSARDYLSILRSVPEAERRKLLTNGGKYLVPWSALDEAGAAVALQQWRATGKLEEDGTFIPMPRPGVPNVVSVSVMPAFNGVVPHVFSDVSNRPNSMGGIGLFDPRSFQNSWATSLSDGWLLPGDKTKNAAAEARTLTPRKESPVFLTSATAVPTKKPLPRQGYEDGQLARLAQASKVSLLAHVPHHANVSLDLPPVGTAAPTVADLLAHVAAHPSYGLIHKWRGNVLLLSYQNWFVHDSTSENVSYALLKRVRDEGDALSVAELCRFARQMDVEQARSLARRFPEAGVLAAFHPVLLWLGKSPERIEAAASEKGIAVPKEFANTVLKDRAGDAPWPAAFRIRTSQYLATPFSASARANRAATANPADGEPTHTYVLDWLDAAGDVPAARALSFRLKERELSEAARIGP